jgi:preprotein translocase subunit SecE
MAGQDNAKSDKPTKAKKSSFIERGSKWVRDLKSEAKKVVWPTRSQVLNNTAVVLITILVVGAFIWILDYVFNFGVSALFGLFS